MKKLLFALLAIVLLAAVAVWYFVSYRLDGLIEEQIETAGTRSFGSQVTVGSVETDLRDGTLNVSEITVANPPGFTNPHAVRMKNIQAAVDYRALEVRRVVIDNPEIVIEEARGKTNFDALLAKLQQEGDGAAGDADQQEPVIVIRHFRMNESRAAFESKSLDRYTDLEVDAVELNNLRGTPTELATVIGKEILREITQEAAQELLKAQAREKLKDIEDQVTDKLRGLLDRDKQEE